MQITWLSVVTTVLLLTSLQANGAIVYLYGLAYARWCVLGVVLDVVLKRLDVAYVR